MIEVLRAARTWSMLGRVTAPLAIMMLCVWLLLQKIDRNAFDDFPHHLSTLPIGIGLLAAAFTALSLWAVARYDVVAHRHFQTEVSTSQARNSGFAAIAIGQAVGFGLIVGTAVRWRMLPHLTLTQAFALSAFVSFSFITAMGYLTAWSVVFFAPPDWPRLAAWAAIIGMPLALLYLSFSATFAFMRNNLHLPSLKAWIALLFWTAIDIVAAAAALYVLIPTDMISFTTFLPVFLFALAAALLSGAPGGLGPFELLLLLLLPEVPQDELIAGVILFRVLYFGLPLIIGLAMVAHPVTQAEQQTSSSPLPRRFANPEHNVLHQNAGAIQHHRQGRYALWQTPQTATLLFDPIEGPPPATLQNLADVAQARNLLPCLYKVGPRVAAAARRQGWSILKCAEDHVLCPAAYDITLPRQRGLRRKLRKASATGVSIEQADQLPLSEMARVDSQWQATHGAARGGSMGRFSPIYVRDQQVFLAYQSGRLIAFATFQQGAKALCLDLMRHIDGLPDGIMHLLVHTALVDAQTREITRVSLAATAVPPPWLKPYPSMYQRFDTPGLRQFKAAFATDREPRYIAARTPWALLICAADLAMAIRKPAPLEKSKGLHENDEDYEVDLNEELCEWG